MDPNRTLQIMREVTKQIITSFLDNDSYAPGEEVDDDAIFQDAVNTLIETSQALDNWLSKGGFPPDEWKPIEITTDTTTMEQIEKAEARTGFTDF